MKSYWVVPIWFLGVKARRPPLSTLHGALFLRAGQMSNESSPVSPVPRQDGGFPWKWKTPSTHQELTLGTKFWIDLIFLACSFCSSEGGLNQFPHFFMSILDCCCDRTDAFFPGATDAHVRVSVKLWYPKRFWVLRHNCPLSPCMMMPSAELHQNIHQAIKKSLKQLLRFLLRPK